MNKLTLEEKVTLTSGDTYWETKEYDGIPKIKMSDGPHGLRIQRGKADLLGINPSDKSICFPTASCVGSSWDKELLYKYGTLLGEECNSEDVNIILGPGVNIKRTPLCGRNFEYFSEDPYLSGMLGIMYTKGVQSKNVGVCVKHFALNNEETRRMTINSIADKKAMNEIYLKPFEMIVKEAKPISLMSSYNRINGIYASENKYIMDKLRNEWKHKGLVITDWGANNNRIEALKCNVELDMPECGGKTNIEIKNTIMEGKLNEDILDENVNRVIDIARKLSKHETKKVDFENHHEEAIKIAEESIILLKNENDILPLNKSEKVVIIGDFASTMRYQGSGSSTINPYKLDNFIDLCSNYKYYKGYNRIKSSNDKVLLNKVIKNISSDDKIILFMGLTENYESEGLDRKTISLPDNQIKLYKEIEKLIKI